MRQLEQEFSAIYERCRGLDIHKRTVVACVIAPGAGRHVRKQSRTFGTMTDDLVALGDWMAAEKIQQMTCTDAEREAMLQGNARRLLRIPTNPQA